MYHTGLSRPRCELAKTSCQYAYSLIVHVLIPIEEIKGLTTIAKIPRKPTPAANQLKVNAGKRGILLRTYQTQHLTVNQHYLNI